MQACPRCPEQWLISESIKAIQCYSRVFHERVIPAFGQLENEAESLEQAEYARLSSACYSEDEDDSAIAEKAYLEGVDFYSVTDSIRRGLINLMVAGLYHHFEQQASALLLNAATLSVAKSGNYPLDRLKAALASSGIDLTLFKTWPLLDELRLLANAVKHGDGRSADELKARAPGLFRTSLGNVQEDLGTSSPLQPLIGQGLELDESRFQTYANNLIGFWEELWSALWPNSCQSP